MASLAKFSAPRWNRSELARRWALVSEPRPDGARGPRVRLLLGELSWVAEPARRALGKMDIAAAPTPRTVMMLPGFGAHPLRMRFMAQQLERAGHTVKRWGMGFNLGASSECFTTVEQRLIDLHKRAGEPIYLIGWSLGGVIARELAKLHPDKVAKVVTMGSPFSGNPRANNGWRAYQAVAGHRVDQPPVQADTSVKPPVETIALWSPRDGVVHPRSACGRVGERDKAIALRCTHMGFVYSPEVIEILLSELEMG